MAVVLAKGLEIAYERTGEGAPLRSRQQPRAAPEFNAAVREFCRAHSQLGYAHLDGGDPP